MMPLRPKMNVALSQQSFSRMGGVKTRDVFFGAAAFTFGPFLASCHRTPKSSLTMMPEELRAEVREQYRAADLQAKARSDGRANTLSLILHYPNRMREEGREGHVQSMCDIDVKGRTSHCRIVDSSGGPAFVQTAEEFLRRVKYAPAVAKGKPVVEHNHVINVDFNIED